MAYTPVIKITFVFTIEASSSFSSDVFLPATLPGPHFDGVLSDRKATFSKRNIQETNKYLKY